MGASRKDTPAQRRSAATLYDRLKRTARAVGKRNPGALGADYDVDDLHHHGFIAAEKVLNRTYGGVLSVPTDLNDAVLKHLVAVAFVAMDHKCIDQLRHRSVESSHRASASHPECGVQIRDTRIVLETRRQVDPERELEAKDLVSKVYAENPAFVRVALVADQQTREAIGAKLGISAKAVSRVQGRLNKKFRG